MYKHMDIFRENKAV